MTTIDIKSLSDIQEAAKAFLSHFEEPTVLAFFGEMGAGKTTFIKAICEELGVVDIVNSPTFAIVNEYEVKDAKSVFHFDLYRMEKPEEVLDIGFEDYIYSGNWCFIEWPAIAESYFPENIVRVKIEEVENEARILTFIE